MYFFEKKVNVKFAIFGIFVWFIFFRIFSYSPYLTIMLVYNMYIVRTQLINYCRNIYLSEHRLVLDETSSAALVRRQWRRRQPRRPALRRTATLSKTTEIYTWNLWNTRKRMAPASGRWRDATRGGLSAVHCTRWRQFRILAMTGERKIDNYRII